MIPDVVDQALFYLMHALDNGLLRAKSVSGSGKDVDLMEDGLGELAGWYIGTNDGWRPRFSEQRFIDDFSDGAQQGEPFGK
jgi:hypothetical protein